MRGYFLADNIGKILEDDLGQSYEITLKNTHIAIQKCRFTRLLLAPLPLL